MAALFEELFISMAKCRNRPLYILQRRAGLLYPAQTPLIFASSCRRDLTPLGSISTWCPAGLSGSQCCRPGVVESARPTDLDYSIRQSFGVGLS